MQTKKRKERSHARGSGASSVHFSLSKELREFIQEQAGKDNRTVSNYITTTLLRLKRETEEQTPFSQKEKSEVPEKYLGGTTPSARTA